MEKNKNEWYCPLYQKNIEDITCLIVQEVVSDCLKPTVLPKLIQKKDYKSYCLECPHYPNGYIGDD